VAVFVALSKNAAANMTAAVMASIQGLPARCQKSGPGAGYVLGVGAGHLIFGFTPT
jgi:hypothetical protein